jgi:hypothetical protein
MFSPVSTFQVVGSDALSATPLAFGPRNCGQSVACDCGGNSMATRTHAIENGGGFNGGDFLPDFGGVASVVCGLQARTWVTASLKKV